MFAFFAGFLKVIFGEVEFQHDFYALGARVLHFLVAPRVGNSPFQKTPKGLALGGGQASN